MTSFEPARSRAYHEDLKWRMVYQREILGLTYEEIAINLCVDVSTVWRTVKRFESEGNVEAKKNKGYHKLSEVEEYAILEAVVETPSIYLKEICMKIQSITGTVVAESTVCRFLQRNSFTRKKLTNIAIQRNEVLRQCFVAECDNYSPEMMVFIDETGCDRRASMRKFGYAMRGQPAKNIRLMCRGIKVSAIAGVAFDGLVTVQCSINEDVFCDFVEKDLLPHLLPFDGVNPRSVVLLDNASIHHTRRPIELIQSIGAIVHFLPPYSLHLNPMKGEGMLKGKRHGYSKY